MKLSSLYSQKQVDGYVVTMANDTIHHKIIMETKKNREKGAGYYSVNVVVGEETKTLYATDIEGYKAGDLVFKSLSIQSEDKVVSFFVQQVTVGKVELYYYCGGGPIYSYPTYLFKRKNEKTYTAFTSERIIKQPNNYQNAMKGSYGLMDFGTDQVFLDYFVNYFKDCPAISRKIKLEFYTRRDAEEFFKEYNSCK